MQQHKCPNLILAGVNKAGTTSLFRYLQNHPNVGCSSVKETCFFLPYRYGEPAPKISGYHRFFEHLGEKEKIVIESTPGYFYGGTPLAEAIAQNCPNVKIVIVLRDPLERLKSFYKFKIAEAEIDKSTSFPDYIESCLHMSHKDLRNRKNNRYFGVEGSLYGSYVEPWLITFGKSVLFIDFDELASDPLGTTNLVLDWVGLSPLPDTATMTVENKTIQSKSQFLHKFAMSFNKNFETLWNRLPGVKRAIRNIYYRLNGSNQNFDFDAESAAKIRPIFSADLKQLQDLFKKYQVSFSTNWMQSYLDK